MVLSCWPGIFASSADNVEGCSLAEFLDLGMLDHWFQYLQITKYLRKYWETSWLQSVVRLAGLVVGMHWSRWQTLELFYLP